MERDPNLQALTSIITSALLSETTPEASPKPSHYQIDTGEGWFPTIEEVWRAWSGQRAIWGVPYHGPVYPLGASPGATPWTGKRECPCDTCQMHVAPYNRSN